MGKYIYFVCAVFVVRTVSTQTSTNCSTPSNLDGVCMDLNLCPSLKALSEEQKKNSSVISFLRNSICGFKSKQYKVCCPLANETFSVLNTKLKPEVQETIVDKLSSSTSSPPVIENGQANTFIRNAEDKECKTPDKLNGICINIQRCKLLDDMYLKNNKNQSIANFLSQSFCGYENSYPKVCCPLNSNYETVWSPRLPSRSTCGVPGISSDKIVGGHNAELGAWPWIAAIGYKNMYYPRISHEWLCGGTLISNIYVLTAAHCTIGPALKNKQLELVRLGDLDLNPAVNDSATPIEYAVLRIIRHEKYDGTKYINDIALLKLNDSVTFTNLIRPICLPILSRIRESTFVGQFPFVAGWGSTEFRGSSSSALLEVQVPVRDNDDCKKLYANLSNVIDGRVLCAGEGDKDSCQGDSGGPLMWPTPTHYYLVGIVSSGVRCAAKEFPGVYTRVSAFIEWIVNNMNNS
ncbi:Hypothetical protein CINCED_3A019456 [Cinara cedri]|nr:Hypothetical protein CINCED_3A019456 [Cinara cedri]